MDRERKARSRRTVIIGAGVIGLTTGVVLSEAGHDVEIIAQSVGAHTTSGQSGAIWGPFLSNLDGRLSTWSYQTLEVLERLSRDTLTTGVEMVTGIGAERESTTGTWWVERFRGSVPIDPGAVAATCTRAWKYSVPIIDVPRYLFYLQHRFRQAGGRLVIASVTLDKLPSVDHVVICAGLGTRELVADPELFESRGRLVIVENPGITRFYAERGDGPHLTYILPQRERLVLGGTAEPAGTDLGSDAFVVESIIQRCAEIEPAIATSAPLAIRSALRPCRSRVRLEHEVRDGRHFVYNYGHGGSGMSTSWGCAQTARALIEQCGNSSSVAL